MKEEDICGILLAGIQALLDLQLLQLKFGIRRTTSNHVNLNLCSSNHLPHGGAGSL